MEEEERGEGGTLLLPPPPPPSSSSSTVASLWSLSSYVRHHVTSDASAASLPTGGGGGGGLSPLSTTTTTTTTVCGVPTPALIILLYRAVQDLLFAGLIRFEMPDEALPHLTTPSPPPVSFAITPFGQSAVRSGFSVDDALLLRQELSHLQTHGLILADDLHLCYFLTPLREVSRDISWAVYRDLLARLSDERQRIMSLIGVNEHYVDQRAMGIDPRRTKHASATTATSSPSSLSTSFRRRAKRPRPSSSLTTAVTVERANDDDDEEEEEEEEEEESIPQSTRLLRRLRRLSHCFAHAVASPTPFLSKEGNEEEEEAVSNCMAHTRKKKIPKNKSPDAPNRTTTSGLSRLPPKRQAKPAAAAASSPPRRTAVEKRLETVACRFFFALLLADVLAEGPLDVLERKYNVSRGQVQALMHSASLFSSSMTNFCRAMEWYALEAVLASFVKRLGFGAKPDILPLMELRTLTAGRARMLWNAGYRDIEQLASVGREEEKARDARRNGGAGTTRGGEGGGVEAMVKKVKASAPVDSIVAKFFSPKLAFRIVLEAMQWSDKQKK